MIVGMMRIKNEQRWIARVLESMVPVCEKIFVFDDHSEDDTVQICRSFPQVELWESPFFEGTQETRDKNYLLEKVEAAIPAGSWVVCIDGDEELAKGSADHIRKTAEAAGRVNVFKFHVLYLWDSEAQIRVDGIYNDFYRTSMFRLVLGQRFKSSTGGGFHCGNAPEPGGAPRTAVKILHYGYLHQEDRIRKWDFYNQHDPCNVGEGYNPLFPERRTYPHIVQGDVPAVPANVKLRWAGPLKLVALNSAYRHEVLR